MFVNFNIHKLIIINNNNYYYINLSNQKYNMGRRTINIVIATNNIIDSFVSIQL